MSEDSITTNSTHLDYEDLALSHKCESKYLAKFHQPESNKIEDPELDKRLLIIDKLD